MSKKIHATANWLSFFALTRQNLIE